MRRKRRTFFRKYFTSVVVASFLLIVALGSLTFTQLRKSEQQKQAKYAREQLWPTVKSSLESSLEEFDTLTSNGNVGYEEISRLKDAVRQWEQFHSEHSKIYFPEADELLNSIQKRKQLFLSDILWKDSLESEKKSKEIYHTSNGNPEQIKEALKHMDKAYRLQKQINDEFPNSQHTNHPRSADLRSWIHTIKAEPLHLRLNNLRTEAESLFEKKEWELAKPKLLEAIEVQNEINNEYPDSPYSDMTEILRLEDGIKESEAQLLYNESQATFEKALLYLEAGKEENAEELLISALDIQNEINLDYSQTSRFSLKKAEEISIQIQNIGAKSLIAKILKMEEDLNLLTSVGMIDKISYKISDILASFEVLEREYPLCRNPPTVIKSRAVFLKKHLKSLPKIVEQFDSLSSESTSAKDPLIKVTQFIPQDLYERVMDNNPSRTVEQKGPVDSVSFEDTLLFCEKLMMLIHKQISLPMKGDLMEIRLVPSAVSDQISWEWITTTEKLPAGKAMIHSTSGNIARTEIRDTFSRSRTIGFRLKIQER